MLRVGMDVIDNQQGTGSVLGKPVRLWETRTSIRISWRDEQLWKTQSSREEEASEKVPFG